MMTEPTPRPVNRSDATEALVELLRTEMDADPYTPEDVADLEEFGLLAESASSASPADLAADSIFLMSRNAVEPIDPNLRTKMIDAVRRGLTARRAEDGPIQALLFQARREAGIRVEDLQSDLEESADRLVAVENGSLAITDFSANHLARWVVRLNISSETARRCLQHSLTPHSPAASFGLTRSEDEIQRSTAYLDEFALALDRVISEG
jgi:hypothetical protein